MTRPRWAGLLAAAWIYALTMPAFGQSADESEYVACLKLLDHDVEAAFESAPALIFFSIKVSSGGLAPRSRA